MKGIQNVIEWSKLMVLQLKADKIAVSYMVVMLWGLLYKTEDFLYDIVLNVVS